MTLIRTIVRSSFVAALFLLLPSIARAQTGSIEGTVTAAGSSTPIPGVEIIAVSMSGTPVGAGSTDATGHYAITPLAVGTYVLISNSTAGHANEIYDDIVCSGGCAYLTAVNKGTRITVTSGATAGNKNFSLALAGRIGGTVTKTVGGGAIAGIGVRALTSTGVFAGDALSDGSGNYQIAGLPAGTYYLVTTNTQGYVNELYDDVRCGSSCNVGPSSTAVAVTAGAIVTGRNFVLDKGGTLTGTVTGTAGAPLAGVRLIAYNSAGGSVVTLTNASGVYTFTALQANQYTLATSGAGQLGYINEIYNNVPCALRCDAATTQGLGVKLNVALEATTSSVDFSLAPGATITGTVTDAGSGAPVPNVDVFTLTSFPDHVDFAVDATTNSAGVFTVPGLSPGIYYAFTSNRSGYINEIYGDIPCAWECDDTAPVVGAPIVVSGTGVTSGINIALATGGRISGAITDAVTSSPIAGVTVNVYDARNQLLSRGASDSSGAYITSTGLPSGTYYAVALGSGGYMTEIFDNVACGNNCLWGMAPAAGTPIVVTAGATTPGKNIALARGGRVTGVVTDAVTGDPISGVVVNVYDGAGRLAAPAFTSGDGFYATDSGLETGSYFASTSNFRGYADEIFDNKPCTDTCDSQANTGTPIAVSAGTDSAGNHVAMGKTGVPGAPTQFRATGPPGVSITWSTGPGVAATSYRLEAGFAPGTTALTFPVAGTTFTTSGVPPGRYYVRVRGINAAGTGPASAEIALTVGAGDVVAPAAPIVNASMVGPRLLLSWERNSDGGVPADYVVEAGSATGLSNIASIAVNRLAFTYDPVPNGFYFLRVRARNFGGVSAPSEEKMIVVGGGPSPPAAPLRLGSSVSGSTVTLSWPAPAGPVSGYILEAGSSPGLSNIAVVPIGNVNLVSFPGIPAGRYYVRIRAVNTLGASVVSNEVIVIVS